MIRTEACYLTREAAIALFTLRAAGVEDLDLAITVLELLWPEDRIYELPE